MGCKEVLPDVVRLVLLVIAFVSGIAVIAIISTLESKFSGRCIVLSDVEWDRPEASCRSDHCFYISHKHGSCSYLIKYQGTACFVSCVWFMFFIVKLIAKKDYSRPLPFVAISSLIYALLALVSASILIAALRKICNGLLKPDFIHDGSTCEDYEDPRIWKEVDDDGTNFIGLLESAQIASWISCCSWLILFITYVIKVLTSSQEIKSQRFENETNVVT